MPLVRIDISKTASCERVRDVGDAAYNAMIAVANVPNYDRFQVVSRDGPDEIIYPEEGSSWSIPAARTGRSATAM
ncbi:MAG TPA: hypothetical protein VHU15_08305 [Stellaceae bacterium]|nr:hypothetical protein [Stellaceae bacterium]